MSGIWSENGMMLTVLPLRSAGLGIALPGTGHVGGFVASASHAFTSAMTSGVAPALADPPPFPPAGAAAGLHPLTAVTSARPTAAAPMSLRRSGSVEVTMGAPSSHGGVAATFVLGNGGRAAHRWFEANDGCDFGCGSAPFSGTAGHGERSCRSLGRHAVTCTAQWTRHFGCFTVATRARGAARNTRSHPHPFHSVRWRVPLRRFLVLS